MNVIDNQQYKLIKGAYAPPFLHSYPKDILSNFYIDIYDIMTFVHTMNHLDKVQTTLIICSCLSPGILPMKQKNYQ